MCVVSFLVVGLKHGLTGDISAGISEAVSDGQACVNDKDRIVSPLPPFLFSPLD